MDIIDPKVGRSVRCSFHRVGVRIPLYLVPDIPPHLPARDRAGNFLAQTPEEIATDEMYSLKALSDTKNIDRVVFDFTKRLWVYEQIRALLLVDPPEEKS